ncbi:glycosyltransferase [Treponema sp.]|uniref:glycosyltransferase n=1 Tax=Treponema sp. TaxID=166 RepID=UPI00298DB1E6|nr:glycosyltransferase [Treponema sp.]MCR5613482.1 glycosyltransferase [Treponema sp.]
MKIAFFTDAYFPRINGVAVSVQSYARELCCLGHDVCVVCTNYDTSVKELRVEHDEKVQALLLVRIPSVKEWISKEDPAIRIRFAKEVRAWLADWNPDIVHINTEFFVALLGVRFAKRYKIPLVYTFHTLWEDYFANYIRYLPPAFLRSCGRGFVKVFLRRADEIIVPTVKIQQTVARYGINRSTYILPTGIPDSIAQPIDVDKLSEFKKQLCIEFPQLKNKKILLYVGRVVIEKNLDMLFSVLQNVLQSIPDAALLFVGGGPELEPLSKRCKNLGLDDSVVFAGYQNRDSLPLFYAISSIFTFPSCTETQGLVTIEAMLCGLPVVAIGEMGTVDVMQGDNGGFMVQNDVKEFSSRVLDLLMDKNLYKHKSLEAKKWGERWLISSLTPKLVERYQFAQKTVLDK